MKFFFFNKNFFFSKKNLKKFIYVFWFICITYLLYKIIKNFNQFSEEIRIEFDQLFFVFIFSLALANVYSSRFFLFLNKLNKYPINYIDWSELFFKTSLMNLFFQGSGHLLRAIELKKKHVGYTTFISVNLFIFLLHFFFFNIIFFLILLYFIKEEKIILLNLSITILLSFILVKKNFFLISINLIKKSLSFYKKNLTLILKNFSFNYGIFFLPKNLLNFFFFTLVIFLLESLIYYIIADNILPSGNLFQATLIFLLIFFLNSIPILKNLFGINELLVGMFVETLDFYFASGVIIQLIVRSTSSISVIVMSIFYYFLSLNRKNLK